MTTARDGRVQAHRVEHERPELVGVELRLDLDAARSGPTISRQTLTRRIGDREQQQELLVLRRG